MKRLAISIAILLLAAPVFARDFDGTGRIYGTVTTIDDDVHTGFLRWGDEEASWDDLFHSGKEDLPAIDDVDSRQIDSYGYSNVRFLDRLIHFFADDNNLSRMFICRFGDIDHIVVTGGDAAELTMKNGRRYEVEGSANDVGGTVSVRGRDGDLVELEWDDIDTIDLRPAPPGATVPEARIYGTVEIAHGGDLESFTGYIQWDKDETLVTDILDGDSRDEDDLEIEFGDIASIERHSGRSCDVELRDGRVLRLSGSNDVNDSNRGIMVEDPRSGRVGVPWSQFHRVVFEVPAGSGPGYDSYGPAHDLRGAVTTIDGERLSGRLAYDLDESESFEMLSGEFRDIEFNVPFSRVAAIERINHHRSVVTLIDGSTLDFDDGQDVSDRNVGLVVYGDRDDDPRYVKWREIERIDFSH